MIFERLVVNDDKAVVFAVVHLLEQYSLIPPLLDHIAVLIKILVIELLEIKLNSLVLLIDAHILLYLATLLLDDLPGLGHEQLDVVQGDGGGALHALLEDLLVEEGDLHGLAGVVPELGELLAAGEDHVVGEHLAEHVVEDGARDGDQVRAAGLELQLEARAQRDHAADPLLLDVALDDLLQVVGQHPQVVAQHLDLRLQQHVVHQGDHLAEPPVVHPQDGLLAVRVFLGL